MHVHAASLVRELDRIPSGLQTRVSLNTITNQTKPPQTSRRATKTQRWHRGGEMDRSIAADWSIPAVVDSDSLTAQCPERVVLDSFHRPAVILCESLNPLKQQITVERESTAQLKESHCIADPPAASANDMLQLNVGGTERRVMRNHMTQGEGVEGTLLAALFSGKFDNRFIKDDKQRVFLNMDSEAFNTIHTAILEARTVQQAARKGGASVPSVSRLLTEADKRGNKGLHDFWIKKLLSPVHKTPASDDTAQPAGKEPSVTAEGIPDAARGLIVALNNVLEAHADQNRQLEGELHTEKMRYEQLMTEIEAVSSFLAPIDGDDPVRSVDVCGEVLSTCQSTIDAMPEDMALKRRNSASVWGGSVNDVPPDHMSRMIDHHRRQRHGASPKEASVPLQLTDEQAQRAFDVNAAMYGVISGDGFTVTPLGNRYRIVTDGTGRVPTNYNNDRVKYDWITWCDAFDGQDKYYDDRGRVGRVSGLYGWLREAVLSMSEGEVRQIILPAGYGRYVQLRLISIE
ncbi:unnamed protein product [Vitrella brassicaformis CCMP3155]|uniref:Potassium channel tetramerisation-type BTB domain-containing protein n=1 Tax=Vitrella brassicaformis (strain CCMP3155) TaxID=1169540 RepID=A0A0G4F321_VITBC|nr:unnamed protein product [Vitrella brassicaformis CCMP3155]|eukprot:CEM05796.1 unnamed protein product [Vitrella brassicaformis CCMP3155]